MFGCCCLCIILIIVIAASAGGSGGGGGFRGGGGGGVFGFSGCEYYAERKILNSKPGRINGDFKRVLLTPRPDYQTKVEAQGLLYHDEPAIEWSSCDVQGYWEEDAAIQISAEQETELLVATQQLHFMCLEAVDKVLNDPKLLRLFRIPSDLWPAMRTSWGLVPDRFELPKN